MRRAIQKLNQYLENMLECAEAQNREGFDDVDRKYMDLYRKTFPNSEPSTRKTKLEYICLRNHLVNSFSSPYRRDILILSVREFLECARG